MWKSDPMSGMSDDVLARSSVFFVVGSYLSLHDLFKLRGVSLAIRMTLYSQPPSFWRPLLLKCLQYRPYLPISSQKIIKKYGLDAAKRNNWRHFVDRAFYGNRDNSTMPLFPPATYISCAGFAYSHAQFPQLYDMDEEVLQQSPTASSSGFPDRAPRVVLDEVPEDVPWHLLAWDLLFMDALLKLYPLSSNGEELIDVRFVATPCMFRRQSGSAVTVVVDEVAAQLGIHPVMRHRLVVFPFDELVRGYEILKARALDWTAASAIRNPMELQPFNYALPAFQRIGDTSNTVALGTLHYVEECHRNTLYLLRVSPWTGNLVGVLTPSAWYIPGMRRPKPPSMEEVSSTPCAHEYAVAEDWLRVGDVPMDCHPCYLDYPTETAENRVGKWG